MERQKRNSAQWYILGLAALVLVGGILISTGTAWARYRADSAESIYFQVRKPVSVYVGKLVYSEDGTVSTFDPTAEIAWQTVEPQQDSESADAATETTDAVPDSQKLVFAVANGTAADSFEEQSQRISIRLLCGLGVWTGEKTAVVTLSVPTHEDSDQEQEEDADQRLEIVATVTPITEDTPLHAAFGGGWMYTFLDEETGEELSWTLEGGTLSYVDMEMTITSDDGEQLNTGLLQLQISSIITED